MQGPIVQHKVSGSAANLQAQVGVPFYFPRNAKLIGVKVIELADGDANTAANVAVKLGEVDDEANATALETIVIPASGSAGDVVYGAGLAANVEVAAGEAVWFNVSATSTNAKTAIYCVEFIDVHDIDANLTDGVSG